MQVFYIWQDVNVVPDAYDSAIVLAHDEEAARQTLPADGIECSRCWASPEYVKVQYIGESPEVLPRVICATFNAG